MTKFFFPFLFVCCLQAPIVSAQANCFIAQNNERLTNYCLLETIKGKLINRPTMQVIAKRLLREGYLGGLKNTEFSTSVFPEFYYSTNINGGNPDKKLRLGDLEFVGDQNLVAQKGILLGLNANLVARKTYGAGRYVDGSFSLSYARSPEHNLSIKSANIQACSQNHFKSQFYLDFCASKNETRKAISSDSTKSVKVSLSNLDFGRGNNFQEKKVSLLGLDKNNYFQKQLQVSLDTIHSGNLATSFRWKAGQRLSNQHVMRNGIGISTTRNMYGRNFQFIVEVENWSGQKFFGVDRVDQIRNISVSTSIDSLTKISIGLSKQISNIDYYDSTSPSLSLTRTLWFE